MFEIKFLEHFHKIFERGHRKSENFSPSYKSSLAFYLLFFIAETFYVRQNLHLLEFLG